MQARPSVLSDSIDPTRGISGFCHEVSLCPPPVGALFLLAIPQPSDLQKPAFITDFSSENTSPKPVAKSLESAYSGGWLQASVAQ
jgi:hypothetical protein